MVATVCSESTFLVLFGVLHTSTTTASILGWLAGAIPNYWLNRSWTWGRRGRASVRRELLPYVVIVLVTLALAVTTTAAVDSWLGPSTSGPTRSMLVSGTFLLVYVLVSLLRFVLLDRLFGARGPDPLPTGNGPTSPGGAHH